MNLKYYQKELLLIPLDTPNFLKEESFLRVIIYEI